jgi:hypothetical protein
MTRASWMQTVGVAAAAGFAALVWAGRFGLITPLAQSQPEFQVGQDVSELLPETAGPTPARTFVIVVDPACADCNASRAFYTRLLADAPSKGYRTVALSLESAPDTRAFVRAVGAEPGGVVLMPRQQWTVRTPTLLLLDRDHRIVRQWFRGLRAEEMPRLITD